MKLLAIPAGNASFLVRPQAAVRFVCLAENDVRPVGEAVQRFEAWLRIGYVVEIVGNLVTRTVVLVVGSAALLDDVRLAWQLRRRLRLLRAARDLLWRPRRLPTTGSQQQHQTAGSACRRQEQRKRSALHCRTSIRCVWMLIRMPTPTDRVTSAVPP
ncbi:MAG: hypothetical protein AW07_01935 [Candidatus Accumulibacter sp. SK-11]|nr:MAG: hypothetical protein AW07_01935 [Candidatus Accumulibacter sp. SK-11]